MQNIENLKLPQNIIKELESLKKDFITKGYMKEDISYGIKSLVSNLFLLLTSFLILLYSKNLIYFLISSAVLGLFYLRMGFFAHDLLHGQIIRGNLAKWIGYPIVSFGQGLSSNWWKAKHGAHHQFPNSYEKENDNKVKTLDSDIDTAPFVCWDKNLLNEKQKNSKFLKIWFQFQKFTFWPILSFLRFIWVSHSLREGDKLEKFLIIAHHIFMYIISMLILKLTFLEATLWLFIGNWIGGFIMGIFSLISHSGLDIYEHDSKIDNYSSVIRTTRNLKYNPITFWLSGGLSNQIEHHLFATLKRKHLIEASLKVKEIMNKNQLEYKEVNFFNAIKILYNSLKIN